MRIALLGDIALVGCFDLCNNPDLFSKLADMEKYLSSFDLVVANLEAPFSVRKKPYGAKSAFLYSDPQNVEILKFLHINAVSLANNHMFDYGLEGYMTTIKLLEENDIQWFGAEGKDVIIERNGNRIVLNGYCCYSTNPQIGVAGHQLHILDVSDITNKIKDYSGNGLLPIMAIHCGIEHVRFPSLESIKFARKLSMIADYVYYGHHTHRLQGLEKINGSLIAHSLGNFIFSEIGTVKLEKYNRESAILELEVVDNRIQNYALTPVEIGDGGLSLGARELSEIIDNNEMFSNALANPAEYNRVRNAERNVWVSARKKMRGFKWFLRHLRPMYFKLYFDAKRNSRMLNKHFISQL